MDLVRKLLLLLLNLVASSCLCHEFSIKKDYLGLPQMLERKREFNQKVRESLLALNVSPETSLKDLINQIRIEADRDAVGGIYSTLKTLSDDDVRCEDYSTFVLKSILAQMKEEPTGPLAKLGKFMQQIVWDKLADCAYRLEMEKLNEIENVVGPLDGLFLEALSAKEGKKQILSKPDDINHQLAELSLSKDRLKTKRMINYATGHVATRKTSNRLDPLEAFMDAQCQQVLSFNHLLETINLARATGDWQIISRPVQRLNEYFRLCLEWSAPDTRAKILTNANKNLAWKGKLSKLKSRLKF